MPASRILDTRFLERRPESSEVIVKRDSGIIGAHCSARVYFNAHPLADLRTSEKLVVHLPPGQHILSAEPPAALCVGKLSEVLVNLKAGVRSTYRIGYGTAGDFSITPTAF